MYIVFTWFAIGGLGITTEVYVYKTGMRYDSLRN